MQTKHTIKCFMFFTLFGICPSLFAWDWSPLVAARIGTAWVDIENGSVLVNETVDQSNKYVGDNNESTADWGVFAGAEWKLPKQWRLQGGIAYDYLNSIDVNGDIWNFELPYLDNYGYNYNFQHQRLGLEGRIARQYDDWYPFVIGNIGIAWNRTSDYKDIAKVPDENPAFLPPSLQGENKSSFTWSMGVGIERAFGKYDRWRLGLNYLYTDLGDAKLKYTNTGHQLDADASAQEVVLQLSYFL